MLAVFVCQVGVACGVTLNWKRCNADELMLLIIIVIFVGITPSTNIFLLKNNNNISFVCRLYMFWELINTKLRCWFRNKTKH